MGKTKSGRLEKNAAIAIVGCGIAGLSTAISLLNAGFQNISIFERDTCQNSRREGFGLTLTYNPKGPLARLGILEQVAQQDCPSRSHYIFNPQGEILGYYGNQFSKKRGFGQRGNLRCPRKVLQLIMTKRFLGLAKELNCASTAQINWNHILKDIRTMAEGKVELRFENKNDPREFDLVVAADGVRSSVIEILAPQCQPRPLNVMTILGIAPFHHPLLTERGFYTIGDGKHRLFTMPYQGDKYSENRRIMWQLSYRLDDDAAAAENSRNPQWLRTKVLGKCSQWHDPVPSLIQETPLETIWGTPLFDRSPKETERAFQSHPRILLVGDALHAMSPFKGQGANQALLDGPLISNWLQRGRVNAAVRGIWRELVARTDKVVQASREAAQFWHSFECIPNPRETQQHCQFSGVVEEFQGKLLHTLSERNVCADLSSGLDSAICGVIEELGIGEEDVGANKDVRKENKDPNLTADILTWAANGDTARLRNLSLVNASAIVWARDEEGRSSLHMAAKCSRYETCRWLLTEACMDPWNADHHGNSAVKETSNPAVLSLFQRMRPSLEHA